MGWLDSDSLGFWDVAIPFYGATHAAAIGGKKVVDAAKGSDILGGGGGTPPSYSPDPNNFSYGLGQYIDAQGVVHPTPEERAQQAAQAQAQNQAAQLDLDKRMGELPEGSPERHELEKEMLRVINEGKAQQEQIASYGGQDNYAAQRTREAIGKQGGIEALGQEAYGRAAPQQEMVASGGQSYLEGDLGREKQQETLAALQNFANQAEGPSAAQAQLKAGTDAAARQQYGMARSQQGGGGAALRNAAFNAAGISGNAANSAAALRAQETEAYRQRQLAALDRAAGYSGQARAADQGFAATRAGQANTDAALTASIGQNNLNAELASRSQNDSMLLGTVGASQQYDSQRDSLAANQSATGTNFEGAKAASAGQQFQAQQAQQAQANRREDQLIGLGTSALGYAAVASDERGKDLIRREQSLSKALETVGNAPGYSYEYKDPSEPGAKPGRQYGPMAQDLEKGPLGATLVKDTPTGKMVDTDRVAMMSASAITELNHKVAALERALGKGRAA